MKIYMVGEGVLLFLIFVGFIAFPYISKGFKLSGGGDNDEQISDDFYKDCSFKFLIDEYVRTMEEKNRLEAKGRRSFQKEVFIGPKRKMISPFNSESEALVKTQAYLEYIELKIKNIQDNISDLFREADLPKWKLPTNGDRTSNMIKMLRDHYGNEMKDKMQEAKPSLYDEPKDTEISEQSNESMSETEGENNQNGDNKDKKPKKANVRRIVNAL